jgi:hypothetical protein
MHPCYPITLPAGKVSCLKHIEVHRAWPEYVDECMDADKIRDSVHIPRSFKLTTKVKPSVVGQGMCSRCSWSLECWDVPGGSGGCCWIGVAIVDAWDMMVVGGDGVVLD